MNKTFGEWIHYFQDPKDKLKQLYEEELKAKNKRNNLDYIINNFENIIENKREMKKK